MTHTYNVTGMSCGGCQATVQKLLSEVPGIKNVSVDLQKSEATIDMKKHIPTSELQSALKDHPKYQLNEKNNSDNSNAHHAHQQIKSIEKKSGKQDGGKILLPHALRRRQDV